MKTQTPSKKIKCEVCGETAVVKTFWAKYCSPSCRQAAWGKRHYDRAKRKQK